MKLTFENSWDDLTASLPSLAGGGEVKVKVRLSIIRNLCRRALTAGRLTANLGDLVEKLRRKG